MKRSIFIAVLGMASATVAFGQGKIVFSNYTSSTAPKMSFSSNPALAPAGAAGKTLGAEVSAELAYYVGTSATDIPTSLAQMTLAPTTIGPFGLAGGDADGSAYAGWFTGSTFQVPGVTGANNLFESFDVLAFIGSSYANASYRGLSSIFQSPTSASSGGSTPPMVAGAWQSSLTVSAVPEPTTLALAGLGGLASLVALRRKKA